jgi:protein-disulfide isomerase
VRLIFKNFPLERMHPWAKSAAVAAECAGEQGHFWELHDMLYQKQDEWVGASSPPKQILGYIKSLGLNEAAFKSCLIDSKTAALIQADIQEGQNRWVNATPTFFINGKRFVGSLQLSALAPLWIDKILKEKGK